MSIGAEPIIYGLIFIGVLVLVEGLYLTVFGKAISLNNKINRRLDLMKKGAGREDVMEQLRKEMNQHLGAKKLPLYSLLAEKAQKGGIAFTPTQLVIVMAALCVIAFIGLTIGTETDFAIRAGVSIVMGVGGVYL